MQTPDEAELLAALVAIPSPTGDESRVAEFLAAHASACGLTATVSDAALFITVAGRAPGPALALTSHLDVVPPGEGWTRPPFTPTLEDGKLYGRGSGDAKASVAAMFCAAADLAAAGGPARGTLRLIFSYGEEGRNPTMARALEEAGSLDAAVVGEPTGLDIAIAQRGLLLAELTATGVQRHAGHAATAGDNAIVNLAQDLVKLDGLLQDRPHAILGHPQITVTQTAAGIARNVSPPSATALLDIRTTPAWSHAEIAAGLRAALACDVDIVSERLTPCATPGNSPLLAAAIRARPAAAEYSSPTCSDWVFMAHLDALKCGPGDSTRSHTPDEWVSLAQVKAARGFYAALTREYLA